MNEISEEMYRRLYRLFKRKVSPEVIAGTLNIPIRTVNHIIERINNSISDDTKANFIEKLNKNEDKNYLDIYAFSKTRYSVIQLAGTLTETYFNQFENELQKAYSSQWKAVALDMSDLYSIDKPSSDLIFSYYQKFMEKEKFLAILNPSPSIEPLLLELGLENSVPVFGTELAFEENAFRKKTNDSRKRILH